MPEKENFGDKPIGFQLEYLKLIERDYVTKAQIRAKDKGFRTNTTATDFMLHKILCRTIKSTKKKRVKRDDEELAHIRSKIKQLEEEIKAPRTTEKMDTAHEEQDDTTVQTRSSTASKKRKAHFDEKARHAQTVSELRKRLKMADKA